MSQLQPHSEEPGPATVKGWGAFFFRPIFVGSPLDRKAIEKLERGRRTLTKALDTEYKGRKVIVTREGLIVIQEETRARTLELLNEIMATLLIRSIPVCGVRKGELAAASIDLASMEIVGLGWQNTIRHGMASEAGSEGPGGDRGIRFYPPENIESMIRQAEVLTGDSPTRMDLLLLLEAYTQHQNSAFTGSFLFSWLAVERWIEYSWRGYLHEQGVSSDRVDRLTDPTWTIDRIVEVLNLCGKIDSGTYEKMTRFLLRRNDIMHKADSATSAESDACFYLILSLVRKRVAFTWSGCLVNQT